MSQVSFIFNLFKGLLQEQSRRGSSKRLAKLAATIDQRTPIQKHYFGWDIQN